MSANTPPKPHTEGMVFTNDETGIKYQFSGGAWRAVSSSASEEVAEAIDNLDLQKVLDKGNVADKGAEFGGKVKVDPGTEGNEAVTYGQLSIVEEELEQLAPSIERGSWTFTLNHPPGVGQYTMIKNFLDEDAQIALCDTTYRQCIIDADGDAQKLSDCNREYNACVNGVGGSIAATTEDWTLCSEIMFNDIDANGVTHTWAGIDSDHYIDVFNSADDGFMVGDITMHGGGTFEFDLVSSRGNAVGLASIKVFKAQGSVDFDQYVRKAGDTMTGTLETTSQILILPDGYGARGKTNMLVVNQRNAADGSIVRVQKQSQDVFKVEHSGDTSLMNNKLVRVATPTSATDGANKQYVDEVASATPTPFTWTLEDAATNTSKGCMRFKDNKFIYLSSLTYEGIQLSNPTDLPSGAHNFSSYMPAVGSGTSLAKTMKIWQQSSSGAWQLKAWMIPYRYRFWYVGWVQIEYKYMEGNMTPSYGSRYGLSLPDLF